VAGLRTPIVALVSRFAAGLRYPTLLVLVAGLFLIDLVIPDVVPFADEILLGLGTLLLASLRKRHAERTQAGQTAPGRASER
jgi:hypothetical protein